MALHFLINKASVNMDHYVGRLTRLGSNTYARRESLKGMTLEKMEMRIKEENILRET